MLRLSGEGQSKLKLSGSGNECKPLERGAGHAHREQAARRGEDLRREGAGQGLTLIYFSAQRKRFSWHRGCVEGLI